MSRHRWVDAGAAGPEWQKFRGKVCMQCGLGKHYDAFSGNVYYAKPEGEKGRREVRVLAEDGTWNPRIFGGPMPSCPWFEHPQVVYVSDTGFHMRPKKPVSKKEV